MRAPLQKQAECLRNEKNVPGIVTDIFYPLYHNGTRRFLRFLLRSAAAIEERIDQERWPDGDCKDSEISGDRMAAH